MPSTFSYHHYTASHEERKSERILDKKKCRQNWPLWRSSEAPWPEASSDTSSFITRFTRSSATPIITSQRRTCFFCQLFHWPFSRNCTSHGTTKQWCRWTLYLRHFHFSCCWRNLRIIQWHSFVLLVIISDTVKHQSPSSRLCKNTSHL